MKMQRNMAVACVAGVIACLAGACTAQMALQPPTTFPLTQASFANTTPSLAIPSAGGVVQKLRDASPPSTAAPADRASAAVEAIPGIDSVAPRVPKTVLLREGDYIYSRVGRLTKDTANGAYFFTFDSDGKQMGDPPMGIIPCQFLEKMESASEDGTKATKFRISGEVTQYRGRNFLYIKAFMILHDLNQGIGAPVGG